MKSQALQFWFALLLAVAVVISSIWVITAKHQSRQLFVELEALNREHDRLQVDWGRLQIEQSTWGTHSRIESLARQHLDLDLPRNEQVVIVVESGP
ncbi:MAG: cell division protein FtsL [Gammaproteobacteria bacterium]